jgi:hypothetical protein
MTWDKNVPATREALHLSDKHADQISHGNRSSIAGKNLSRASNADIGKARDVLHGHADPEDILTTQKIGHFYSNIRDPAGHGPQGEAGRQIKERHPAFYEKVNAKGATVDGRADSILKGRHIPWGTNLGLSTQPRYDYESGIHETAAKELGVRANQVQATTWTVGEAAGKGKKRKPGDPLEYTNLDKSQPIQHQPAQFGKSRMAQGKVPRSIMNPGKGPLGARGSNG